MRLKVSSLVFALLLVSAAPQNPSGSVTGRVLRADNEQPVAGARLQLTSYVEPANAGIVLAPQVLPIVSDGTGTFLFDRVNPGRYTLSVDADTFTRQSYGPIAIESGKDLKNLFFRLKRDSTVSGRILSDTGPVQGIQVFLLRSGYDANGRPILTAVANARTNDRGEYRMFGLEPGRYSLVARSPQTWNNTRPVNVPVEDAPNYSTTYYPGTSDRTRATLITLEPGGEAKADVVVRQQNTYNVRGRIAGITLDFNVTAGLTMVPTDAIEGTGSTFGVSPRGDGTFEFQRIPPGNYSLVGISPLGRTSRGSDLAVQPPVQIAIANVEVFDSNVENAQITFAPLARIPGQFLLPGRSLVSLLGSYQIQAELIRAGSAPKIPPVPGRIVRFNNPPSPGGGFVYDGVIPGDYDLRFRELPPNVYVKEAQFGDTDALVNPITIASNDARTLSIVLSTEAGQIQGTIADWEKRPSTTTEVVLIPDRDRNRLGLYQRTLVDAAGHFNIGSIPPGDYRLFAWEDLTSNAYFDPTLIRDHEEQSVQVQISGSSTRTLDIKRIVRK